MKDDQMAVRPAEDWRLPPRPLSDADREALVRVAREPITRNGILGPVTSADIAAAADGLRKVLADTTHEMNQLIVVRTERVHDRDKARDIVFEIIRSYDQPRRALKHEIAALENLILRPLIIEVAPQPSRASARETPYSGEDGA